MYLVFTGLHGFFFHVGDELHALMECKKIQGCRKELLEILRNECKSNVNMNVTEQFIMMSYEGPLLPRIAKFMQEIL